MRVSPNRPLLVLVPLAVAATAAGATTATAQAPGDPRALLATAGGNLAKVRSLHLVQTSKDEDGTLRVAADVKRSGDADVRLRLAKSGLLRVRRVSSATFLQGDRTYWRGALGTGDGASAAARRLAGRWIRVARGDAAPFTALVASLTPKALARCVGAEGTNGTLGLGAPARYGGRAVTVLTDAGDLPGTAPGQILLSTGSTVLPVRARTTGPVRPGGARTACTDPESTTTSSDLRLSRFDRAVTIRAPKGAIRAPRSSGGGGGSDTSLSR